jgi:hypothetical protein
MIAAELPTLAGNAALFIADPTANGFNFLSH